MVCVRVIVGGVYRGNVRIVCGDVEVGLGLVFVLGVGLSWGVIEYIDLIIIFVRVTRGY